MNRFQRWPTPRTLILYLSFLDLLISRYLLGSWQLDLCCSP
jgi:hypothetical protein